MSPATHSALLGLRNAGLFFAAWLYLGFVSQAVVRLAARRGDGR